MAETTRPLTPEEMSALQQYLQAQAAAGQQPTPGSPAGAVGALGAGGQVPSPQNAPSSPGIQSPQALEIIRSLAGMGLHGLLAGGGGLAGTMIAGPGPGTVAGIATGDVLASKMEPHINIGGAPLGDPSLGQTALSAGLSAAVPAATALAGRGSASIGGVPGEAYDMAVNAGKGNLGKGTLGMVTGNAENQIANKAEELRSILNDTTMHPATFTKDAIIDRLDAQGVMVDVTKMTTALRTALRERIGRGVAPEAMDAIQTALNNYANRLEDEATRYGQGHKLPIRVAEDSLRVLDDQLAAKFASTSASDTMMSASLKKARAKWDDAILSSIPSATDRRLVAGLNDTISSALSSKEALLSQFSQFTSEQKIRAIMDPDHVALRRAIGALDASYGTNFLEEAKQLAAKARWSPSDWQKASFWDRKFGRYFFRPLAKGAAVAESQSPAIGAASSALANREKPKPPAP